MSPGINGRRYEETLTGYVGVFVKLTLIQYFALIITGTAHDSGIFAIQYSDNSRI